MNECLKRGLTQIGRGPDGTEYMIDQGVELFRGKPETRWEQYIGQEDESKLDPLHVKEMDEIGLDVAVISPVRSSDYPPEHAIDLTRVANEAVANLSNKYPGRFVGLASLPIRAGVKAAVAELEGAVQDCGMKGVCMSPCTAGDIFLDNRDLWPLYEKVTELDLPIYFHPRYSPFHKDEPVTKGYYLRMNIGFMLDTFMGIVRLIYGGVLDDFPNLKLIFSHMGAGAPFLADRLNQTGRSSKFDFMEGPSKNKREPSDYLKMLYYENGAWAGPNFEPAFLCTYNLVGPEHILLGTDYPWYPLDRGINGIKQLPIPEDEKKKILSENAKRLFKL